MIGEYPITWLLCEIGTVILTILCMYRALRQENYKYELFRLLMFIVGAAIFENIGVLLVKMYYYDQHRLMMFGVVPLSVLMLEADILYVGTILFEKLNLPKWTSVWVIGFFAVFMDLSIDPVFINDAYLFDGVLSGQWNWTWSYESSYFGIPYMNFSGWLYMTGLYAGFMYFLEWISAKIHKPVLKSISPFIAGVLLIVPIAICRPLMSGSSETIELVKMLLNFAAAIIMLIVFRKRRGTISFREEPLLIIVPAGIYVYSLVVIAVRGLWNCLPPVLICMMIHAVYYLFLSRKKETKPQSN